MSIHTQYTVWHSSEVVQSLWRAGEAKWWKIELVDTYFHTSGRLCHIRTKQQVFPNLERSAMLWMLTCGLDLTCWAYNSGLVCKPLEVAFLSGVWPALKAQWLTGGLTPSGAPVCWVPVSSEGVGSWGCTPLKDLWINRGFLGKGAGREKREGRRSEVRV